MPRRTMLLGLATAALGVGATAASGSTTVHRCGNLSPTVGNIKARNTTCKTAKRVVRADVKGKKYDGWTCKSKQINTGAQVTCTHAGHRKVTYQVAD